VTRSTLSPSAHARAYCVGIDTDYPLRFYLDSGHASQRVALEWSRELPEQPDPRDHVLFQSRECLASGGPALRCWRSDDRYTLAVAGVASFALRGASFDARLGPDGPRNEVEVALFGTVLAFWLELQGTLALHAAAVAGETGAILLLGGNGGGKSALAAALMRRGLPLLSDDIVAVDTGKAGPVARPSYPQMRMWPELARHFVGDPDSLPRVVETLTKRRVRVGPGGFGAFCPDSVPVAAVYVPVRRDPADQPRVESRPLGPASAVTELVGRSFLPRLTAAAGLQPERLRKLCSLAEVVRVRQLVYPAGLDRLDEVAGMIVADLGG
jgi:hypothetical protein